MHAARLTNSDRLKRVQKLLSDGKSHSTLDIVRRARVCAVSAAISELRYNGYEIDCKRRGSRFYYTMRANRAA